MIIQIPADDNRERYVCVECETIHYRNPKIVSGCIPVHEDKILLCRRSIEPKYGYWTLPAGFMEMDETTLEAARRETLEEANARVEIEQLYSVINLPYVNQVYMIYRSRLLDLDFSPGEESLETRLFTEQEIPWNEIAFRTIKHTLEYYFADRAAGEFRLHTGDILRQDNQYNFVESVN